MSVPAQYPTELEALYNDYQADHRFNHLRATGINFVPGAGPVNPVLMIVGEAPGRLENARRYPFVGKAGAILTDFLERLVLIDPWSVFMTNTVKYWPNNMGSTRSPEDDEVEASKEYLKAEIETINPKFVALCGKYSMQAIFPEFTSVGKWNGKILQSKYIPLYHPSFVQFRPEMRGKVEEGYKYLSKYIHREAA